MEERKWSKIPRISRTVPFGYELDPEDGDVLVPIPFQLEALEQAKKHLKQYSDRQVAEWLSGVTGRKISHMGLRKRVERDRINRARAFSAQGWAVRAEKIAEKARELEAKAGLPQQDADS